MSKYVTTSARIDRFVPDTRRFVHAMSEVLPA